MGGQTRAWLVAVVSVLGCRDGQAQCEHARDVFMDHAQTQLDDVLVHATPEERAVLDGDAAAELARGRQLFVGECMKLDGPARACVARIDELVAIDERRRAAHLACPLSADELPDFDCLDRANEAAEAELGDCKQPLEELAEAVWARAAAKE